MFIQSTYTIIMSKILKKIDITFPTKTFHIFYTPISKNKFPEKIWGI